MIWAVLTVSSFLTVFLMGLQTKNVVQSQYILAFVTSLGISVTNMIFIRFAANDDFFFVVLFGAVPASVGICCSIYVHNRWFTKE